MSNPWPYPGARWWKFDFHTHTPASKDTNGWQRAVGTPDELTPEKWLLKYMAAGIDCVAITDHNSGAWIDKLKATYAEMQANQTDGFRELHLFPGVEISVSSGLHVLAIFDKPKTSDTITSLLGGVGFPEHLYGETNAHDEAACSRESLVKVIEEIERRGGIAIPAHADDDNGLLKGKGNGCSAEYSDELKSVINSNFLAIEVRTSGSKKPSIYTQSKVSWTDVIGSDCHNFKAGYPNLPGSRYTWIKMAHPSLEGLRLALLDGEGVSVRRSDEYPDFKPFKTPQHFIESISISEAHAMGRRKPAVLKFSPYFNAIVGGRGTGKSTVIHALRLAYRREEDLSRLNGTSESRKTFERFNQVYGRKASGGLRADTEIRLMLSRDGVSHCLRWRQDGQGIAVEEAGQPSPSQSITPQRFPVRLFSQGQIAALVGNNQDALLNIIDEAAGTAIQWKAFEEAKNAYKVSRSKLYEITDKLKNRDSINIQLADVIRKLNRFEEAGYAETLKAYQRASQQIREINLQTKRATEFAERLRNLAEELVAENIPDGLFDPTKDQEALAGIHRIAEVITEAKMEVEKAAARLTETGETIRNKLPKSLSQQSFNRAYSAYLALVEELREKGISDPDEYGRLVQERQRLEMEIRRQDALQLQYEDLKRQSEGCLEAVWEARRAISRKRKGFLNETLQGNEYVSISLQEYMSSEPLVYCLDENPQFPPREGSWLGMKNGDPIQIREEKIKIYQQSSLRNYYGNKAVRQYELGKKYITRDFREKAGKGLVMELIPSTSDYDEHFCEFPEDFLEIRYSRKGDGKDFQPIAQASAGQRAAAMLAFLLAYGDEPLILDQPEDDLDNHLIYNLVVEQIRAHKQRRQLIVVTHNPNIVVNGDAEMVYAMDFNHQCHVKESGSLQDKSMRDEVCRVMEGGQEAFQRRWRRLGREV